MENTPDIKTPQDVIEAVGGRDALALAINAVPRYVADAARQDKLPAAWFDTCERLSGRTLPRHLFSFKGAA